MKYFGFSKYTPSYLCLDIGICASSYMNNSRVVKTRLLELRLTLITSITIPSTSETQASVLEFWVGTSPVHYSQTYFKEILGAANIFCITYVMIIFISSVEFKCLSGNFFLN